MVASKEAEASHEAGLSKYFFESTTIRDQCSWVHLNKRDNATAKARDLVRTSAMRASLLSPLEEIRSTYTPRRM